MSERPEVAHGEAPRDASPEEALAALVEHLVETVTAIPDGLTPAMREDVAAIARREADRAVQAARNGVARLVEETVRRFLADQFPPGRLAAVLGGGEATGASDRRPGGEDRAEEGVATLAALAADLRGNRDLEAESPLSRSIRPPLGRLGGMLERPGSRDGGGPVLGGRAPSLLPPAPSDEGMDQPYLKAVRQGIGEGT
ncbi:MAG: hypothetical protein HY722_16435 [Planctomycetes bacterium]|nr:hypothetical protein [Planctomycetota bacterium]